ncbi:YciI family protein [Psychrobacter aestuarii]|uniref:YciI family protein n=1 Tax=Psychrobacter aestuarii TaxID=556327 RepID=A0ABN0VLF1_9GAMM|nr:YciI family protein [Psychrobacter aestuarii]
MSLFVFIGHDVADSTDSRKAHRAAHLARLEALDAAGRLVIAGPNPITHGESAMSGSVVIADFESIEAAQAWADEEPYLHGGVYSHVDIKPFIHVLPKAQ